MQHGLNTCKTVRSICPSPQKRGVVHRGQDVHPQKAQLCAAQDRPCASDNGYEVTAYIPGVGHNLQEHSVVMIRGGPRQGPARRALTTSSAVRWIPRAFPAVCRRVPSTAPSGPRQERPPRRPAKSDRFDGLNRNFAHRAQGKSLAVCVYHNALVKDAPFFRRERRAESAGHG